MNIIENTYVIPVNFLVNMTIKITLDINENEVEIIEVSDNYIQQYKQHILIKYSL